MKKLFYGLAVLPFLAGASLAAQPAPLTDQQMDVVTAGFDFAEIDTLNGGTVVVAINHPAVAVTGAFLDIAGTKYPGGVQSFQLMAFFGPVH